MSGLQPQPDFLTAAPPDVTLVAHDVGGVGGMERVLTELITGLLREGHRVTVISRTCALPTHERLRWIRVPGPGKPFAFAYPWFFLVGSLMTWRKRRGIVLSTGAIVTNRVDFSSVHFCHRATGALGLSRVSRRTVFHRLNARFASWLSLTGERMCYRPKLVGTLIGVSHGVSAELAEHFPNTSRTTVPNGVSLERFRPDSEKRAEIRYRHGLPEEALVALFVGGEWERKGLSYAIEALAQVEDWTLMVVGEGDIETYREIAASRNVLERVVFAGTAEDPSPYYCASDVFVLPTSYETFSLVTYEAAASGVPLLVTSVNGVTDLLRDGENGWYIEPDAAFIGAKLSALSRDPMLRAEMGAAGRRAAAAFSWPEMVSGYRSLLDHRPTRLERSEIRTPLSSAVDRFHSVHSDS